MWNDNDRITEIFVMADEGRTQFPCLCPVCQSRTAHIYIHRHNDKHCGIWTWCSECGASSHMSGKTPTWWVNPDFVDAAQLFADPSYLNEMSGRIDEWANSLVPSKTTDAVHPFVIENKFDVILKEDTQGIPAGTAGVLVIRDDFRTVTIDFVGEDGKTVHINEAPERIAQLVDVVD